MGIMDDARARVAGQEPDAAPPRPRRIDGSPADAPRPAPLAIALVVACCLALPAAMWLLFSPPAAPAARPALDAAQPTPAPLPTPTTPATAPPMPGPIAVLTADALAYDAPGGAVLGDVGGRGVARFVEVAVLEQADPRGAMWVRAAVADAGLVWLPLGSVAGQAVALVGLPCRGACSAPTATAAPVYVAPAPAAPPPPVYVVEPAPADAVPLTSVERPTSEPPPPAATNCPVVLTGGCRGNLVEVKP